MTSQVTAATVLAKAVGFVTDDDVEQAYQNCCNAASGVTQILVALELERKGGPCPYCARPFKRVDVGRRTGKFSFYEPGCKCFKVCVSVTVFKAPRLGVIRRGGSVHGCGRYLVAEKLQGIEYCTTCSPLGMDRVTKRKKKEGGGEEEKAYDGKAAAAGEKQEG